MFEALKQKPTGMTTRERTRLVLSIAGIVVLGGLIFGGGLGAIAGSGGVRRPVLATTPHREGRTLDPTAFADLRESGSTALDTAALRSALAQVAEDRALRRRPLPADRIERERVLDRRLSTDVAVRGTPKDVAALDQKARAGALVEVTGTVRDATETFSIEALGAQRRLWAFVVEGDDGARVAVIDGEQPRDRRPPDAVPADEPTPEEEPTDAPTQRPPLADGMRVHVRGFYLQRVQGAVGALTLDAPAPLLVGREYRGALGPVPAVPSLAGVAWDEVRDRTREDTWRGDDLATDMAMRWAADRGHDAILASIRSGELKATPWGRPAFLQWLAEIETDKPKGGRLGPDKRTFTRGSRGKLFTMTGILVSYEKEDWDRVRDNAYDVRERYVYRLRADHYTPDAFIPFVSPFPITAFPGVGLPSFSDDVRPQRLRVHGVFARNVSYEPHGPSSPEGRAAYEAKADKDVTVPQFVALHVEPDPFGRPKSFLQNALFIVGCVMALMIFAFWLVMRRVDRREDLGLREREARFRRRVFSVVPGSRTGTTSPSSSAPAVALEPPPVEPGTAGP